MEFLIGEKYLPQEFLLHQFWMPSREMLLNHFLPKLEEYFPEDVIYVSADQPFIMINNKRSMLT